MTIKVTYNVTDVYMSQSVSPVYINVSYSDGGASGGGVWGSITGTLSNQTDLQTALDAKLDESTIDGGTEGQILSKASATDFDFAWINNYAKYLATNVRNQTGSTINAFQVVYISGATGNKPLISLADADTEATSSKTYGVTATAISNNGTGDVVTAGELSGINTSAFNEGDLLWLSTTAGGVVTTPPAEPAHSVFIGYVVRSHPTLGVIDVAIANGYELNELHGVQITTPTDNQGLFYNATSTLWENKSIATALGYTPVPTTRNITINGVTYDLSADRTWTISTGISGSGTTNYLPKFTDATTLGNSLMREGNFGISISAAFNTNWAGAAAVLQVGNYAAFGRDGNGYSFMSTNAYNYTGSSFRYMFGSLSAAIYNQEFGRHIWKIAPNGTANSDITWTIAMSLLATGNLLLNGTTDNGQRLQVYGDTLLRGSGNTSATTALTVQNSDSTVIFRVKNNAAVDALSYNIINNGGAGIAGIFGPITGFTSDVFNIITNVPTTNTNTSDLNIYNGNGFATITSGTRNYFNVAGGLTTSSGTGVFNLMRIQATINQTGGANGITRGLYIIPTLTAAADWRSIEWSNNSGWGLYGAGTANNYLSGSLGIGTTGLTQYNLRVLKNISGATISFGVVSEGTVQSDVTSAANYFTSVPSTQNTTFTLNNLRHYYANQGAFGASSSVTTQTGFAVESTLTGATNNYGFRGLIASGTGRWNLYMDGTADNYLAGDLGIGTTSVTNWLNIAASTTAKAHINLVAGSTPTAPANGDIWFDGTDIKMRIGGVTKTFTLV